MIILIFLCLNVVCGEIFSSRQSHNEHQPLQLKLLNGILTVPRRIRRDSTEAASTPPKSPSSNDHNDNNGNNGNNESHFKSASSGLKSHVFTLNNSDKHSEALVQWTGDKNNIVIVLTRLVNYTNGNVTESTLWRSDDYGLHFTKIKVQLPGAVIKTFVSSSINKKMIIFTDVHNKALYITKDEGSTLDSQKLSFPPDKLIFHPTKENSLLAYSTFQQTVYASKDLGKMWTLVHENVSPRVYWSVPKVDKDDTIIHMQVLDTTTGDFRYKACAEPYCTDKTLVEHVGDIDVMSLWVEGRFIFLEKAVEGKSKLYVSKDRKPFKQALFGPNVKPQAYYVLDSSEGQVFMAVFENQLWADLYLSDFTGQFYTKTLENILSQWSSYGASIDLYKVESINGAYIANRRAENGRYPQTVITFDKGGNWSLIQAPKLDYNGKPIICKNCQLHLHLNHSSENHNIPNILSESNAPGIIMANGMIGQYLNTNISDLFLSTDGGLTWKMQLKGSYITKIVDQGGAFIAVEDNPSKIIKRNSVMYTCDEGKTWENYTFVGQPVVVDGLLTEPGLSSLNVTVYGHPGDDSNWTLILLNFGSLLTQKCIKSDYVKWSPKKDNNLRCVLGRNFTYVRRKYDAHCFNGPDYKNEITSELCPCEQEDFECDYGFKAVGKRCIKENWFNPDRPIVDCPEHGTFNKSNALGFRKVASDKCTPSALDDKYKTTVTNCSTIKPDGLAIHAKHDDELIFEVDEDIEFILTQELGSKLSTKYEWNFGDQTSKTATGFKAASSVKHRFSKSGTYKVSVTASNNAGKNLAGFVVNVFDDITGVDMDVTHGVKLNKRYTFNCSALPTDANHGNVFYAWKFGDEDKTQRAILTYNTTVEHVYRSSGVYTGSVEAFNDVSRFYRLFYVYVYANSQTVKLKFDAYLDEMKIDTEEWRLYFSHILTNTIHAVLNLDDGLALDVVVNEGIPTTADVEITPANFSKDNKTIATWIQLEAKALVRRIANSFVMVNLGNGYVVQITGATANYSEPVVPVNPPTNPAGTSSKTAVYICVPILLTAIFVSALVVLYYRRKFRTVRRYTMMRSHSNSESLLDDDDDDDDPPLDPNPNILNEDMDDDLMASVGEPTLVMMTGTELLTDDDRNRISV